MPGKFINEITSDTPAKDDLAVFFDKSKNSTAQATIAEMVNAGLDLAAGAKGQVPTIDVKVDAATSSLVNILTWGAGGGVDFKGTPTRPPAATDEILTNDPVNGLVGKTTLQQLVVAGGATILQPGTAVNTAVVWNDTAGKWEPARAVSEAKNINGGATGELPFQLNTHVTAWIPLGNAGQVLTIGDIGAAGSPFIAPMWSDPVNELPAFTIADKGKQLTVKADGKATEWVNDAKELPAFTGTDVNKRLVVVGDLSGTIPTPPPHLEWKAPELPAITAGLTALQTKADKSGVEWVASVNQSTNLKGGFTAGAFFPVNDTKTDTTRFVDAAAFRKLAGVPELLYFPNWTPTNDQAGAGWNDMGVALARMASIVSSDTLAGKGSIATSAASSFPGGYGYSGAIVTPNGKVVCFQRTATSARVYDIATGVVSTLPDISPGKNDFLGGVLLLDGRVFFAPYNSPRARIYDPVSGSVTTPAPTFPGNGVSLGNYPYSGAVLLLNGKVFLVPGNATAGMIYDPTADAVSTPAGTYPGSLAFSGGVLLPSGKVFCVPADSTTARIYDPATDTLTTPSGSYLGNSAFNGGVLLPNGKVFCVPSNSTTARIYDPVKDILSTPTGTYPGNYAYSGGVLLPNGKVFCVPGNATTARVYDPVTDTLTTPPGSYPGGAAYSGGVLMPNGKVFCVPHAATAAAIVDFSSSQLPTIPSNMVLSPFFNKF